MHDNEPALTIAESSRDTSVQASCDVLVAGGGPAGILAALSAARNGAQVQLVDTAGCLGGVWTAGLLCFVLGSENKSGIITELTAELDRRDARQLALSAGSGEAHGATPNWAYDPEEMKLLLEERCIAAGIGIQLHTRVVAGRVDHGRLTHVITESASGRQAWAANVFIDCTGGGDLAARIGCGFDVGRPDDGAIQPMSFPCLIAGIEYDDVRPYVAMAGDRGSRDRLTSLCRSLGVELTYPKPMLVRLHDNLFSLICDHQFGFRSDDAAAVTAATLNGRREVHAVINALRGSGGIWKELRLVATCEHIGVREGRRIHGRTTITADDVVRGHQPPDSISICRFGVDVHSPKKNLKKAYDSGGYKAQPYGIPLRALIARDVDGLMMAGRCISGDFIAHSSYRVTGDAAAMGQAAGICAARAADRDILPQDVSFGEVKAGLDALNAPVTA